MADNNYTDSRTASTRVGVQASQSADLTAPGVSLAPVKVKPSPLAAFTEKIVPAFTGLARRDAETTGGVNPASLATTVIVPHQNAWKAKLADGGNLSPTEMMDQSNKLLMSALQTASENKLAGPEFTAYMKIINGYDSTNFDKSLLTITETSPGLKQIIYNGDMISTFNDREAFKANTLVQIQETLGPQTMAEIDYALNGLDSMGNPAVDPEGRRRQGEAALYLHTIQIKEMEALNYDASRIAAATNAQEQLQKKDSVLSKGLKARHQQKFFEIADSIYTTNITEDVLNKPPEVAIGLLRRELEHAAGSTEAQAYRTMSGEADFHEKLIDRYMTGFESLIRGLNSLEKSRYTTEQKRLLIQSIGQDHLLSQGKVMIGLMQNSQALGNMMAGLTAAQNYSQTPGGMELPGFAGIAGIISGQAADSFTGTLNFMAAEKDPAIMAQQASHIYDLLLQNMDRVDPKNPQAGFMTPYHALRNVMEAKSSPAIERYLLNKSIPRGVREGFIQSLNRMQEILSTKGISLDEIQTMENKTFKPSELFTTGLPDEEVVPPTDETPPASP